VDAEAPITVEDQSLMGAASGSDAQRIGPCPGQWEQPPRDNKRPRSADSQIRSPPGSIVGGRECHKEVSSATGGPETIVTTGKALKSGKGTSRKNTTLELSYVEPVTSRINMDEHSWYEHAATPNEMHEVAWNAPATSPMVLQENAGSEPATYQNDMQEGSGDWPELTGDDNWDPSPLDESPLG